MDNAQRLGVTLKQSDHGEKDAIHIPIIAVQAGQSLKPGDRVKVDKDGVAWKYQHGPGVVDPYLRDPVQYPDFFWVFMDTGTITSLRHDWDHPEVLYQRSDQSETDIVMAKAWINDNISYPTGRSVEQIMQDARDYIREGKMFTEQGGQFRIRNEPDLWEWEDKGEGRDGVKKFWECFEIITGEKSGERANIPYTCCY